MDHLPLVVTPGSEGNCAESMGVLGWGQVELTLGTRTTQHMGNHDPICMCLCAFREMTCVLGLRAMVLREFYEIW